MHDVPVLIGDNSYRALERAALLGQGWLGLERYDKLDVAVVARSIQTIRDIAKQSGADPYRIRMVLRIIGSQAQASVIRAQLSQLAAAGVTDLIVDTRWDSPDAESVAETLKG